MLSDLIMRIKSISYRDFKYRYMWIIKIEERHTDSEENNIVQHVDKLQEVFENNKIANNTIYFIILMILYLRKVLILFSMVEK